MAAALVVRRSRAAIRSLADIRVVITNLKVRSMSSNDSKAAPNDSIYHELGDQDAKKVWPDTALSFDPYDQLRFPLPGNSAPVPYSTSSSAAPPLLPITSVDADLLNTRSRYQMQAEVLSQHKLRQIMAVEAGEKGTSAMNIELKVQDCPVLMRKDFQMLFPGYNVMSGDFTVVSLCQKTSNDMSGWSEQVEGERELLIKHYSETALELCSVLRNSGFWADFIDPCSGKPHLGIHTTDSMFETDERYRHFGFDIEDLGCCKVIKHHKWGTKSFVGCVFTNAPADSPVLVELTQFTEATAATD